MLNLIIAVSLLVSPLRLEVSSYPGVITREIAVKNGDAYNEAIVTVYKGDWDLSKTGTILYYPADSLSSSCSKWITVNPSEFILPPGAIQNVRVTFEIPEDSKGGYWSVIFFEGKPPEEEEWTPLVKLAGRVGITAYLEVAGTAFKQAEIKKMKLGKSGNLNMEVANKGNIWVRPRVNYWVMRGDSEIYQDSLGSSVILPNSIREYELMFGNTKIQKGDEIIARVDYGGDKILEGVKKVE
jgi:P pilus assembly chaperone PapD